MRSTVRINAVLDSDLLQRLDEFARSRREDRSTALRQLVELGLRELAKRDAVDAYRRGHVTLREFASTLHLGIWEAHDLLAAEGVGAAQGLRSETVGTLNAVLTEGRTPR
jgi:hypothetical protein